MPQDVGGFDALEKRQRTAGGACSKRRIQFAHAYEDIISVENLLEAWKEFLRGKRKKRDVQEFEYRLMDEILALHPGKCFIKSYASGADFLGWAHFADHRVLRTATKRRMLKRLSGDPSRAMIESYRGLLSHGNAKKLGERIARI